MTAAPPPEPHAIQRAALAALTATRAAGRRTGLVVLATSLGKTWLAAFDSRPFARVLFVAHRDEILTQAMAAFRRIRPEARFGRFDGAEKDEFHHASAASYRGLLDHFTPRFLLGLTPGRGRRLHGRDRTRRAPSAGGPGRRAGPRLRNRFGEFPPEGLAIRAADRQGAAIVGSSNLSRTALTTGVEWNLHAEGAADMVARAFEDLWTHPRTRPLTPDWIAAYAARRQGAPLTGLAQKIVADEPPAPPPEPHAIQRAALAALAATRAAGQRAGLVVLATGLGKTWLAAFDSCAFARVLFVAHRDEILTQAMASFRRIRSDARFDLTF